MDRWKRLTCATLMALAALCLPPVTQAGADRGSAPPLLVPDAGAGKLYLLDGATFDLLHQTTFPYPLHEAVALAPDGGHAYLSSPQGWIVKVDLASWQTSTARVARESAALALSHDGRYLMAANRAPATLVALDAGDLSVLRVLEAKEREGKPSAVTAVHALAGRKSFVAVMGDIPELWELSYDEHAERVFDGLVHDYKMGEGIALKGPFPPRRTVFEQPLAHFSFDQRSALGIGAGAGGLLQVIHLDVRRKIRQLHLDGDGRPDLGARMEWMGRPVLVLPDAGAPLLHVLDLQTWQVVRQLAGGGAGARLFSHDKARHAWVAAEGAPTQILDKQSLAFVPGIAAALERASAPLAWSRDGRFAVLREHKAGAAFLVCDTGTLEIVRRLELP